MFWYNVIQLDYDRTTEEFEVRLKIGQILFDAGARPVMNQDVYTRLIEKTNNHQYKSDVCKEKNEKNTSRIRSNVLQVPITCGNCKNPCV